jgi:hypothetical protein
MEMNAGDIFKQMKAQKDADSAAKLAPGTTDGVTWVTAQKERIPLSEMEDKHLANAAMMLQRGIASRQQQLAFLEKERDRRLKVLMQAEAEAAQKKRRMSSLSEPTTRFIRDED